MLPRGLFFVEIAIFESLRLRLRLLASQSLLYFFLVFQLSGKHKQDLS